MRISIENSIQQMTILHSQLKEFYLAMGIEDEPSKKLSITIDEVISNIILYGYEDNNLHHISLSIDPGPTHYILEFIDDGKYFDPLEYLKKNTIDHDLDKNGGVGLKLVYNISSKMQYTRLDHKNILVLTIPY